MPYISWTEALQNNVVDGFDLTALKRDQCYVTVVNNSPAEVYLQRKYKECPRCPYTNVTETVISTTYDAFYRIVSSHNIPKDNGSSERILCELDPNFGQFGVYKIQVNNTTCNLQILQDSVNIYFPILTVFLIYAALILLTSAIVFFIKRWRKNTNKNVDEAAAIKKRNRVKSLDTFRGICIVGMIFVNYGAGGYEILEHAVWNGIQLADIFFPWFLWIMGFCIPISVNSALKRTSRKSAFLNITRRSVILFLLGLFLTSGPYLNTLRIFGVLQRFGVCYFVVAGIQIWLSKVESPDRKATLSCLCEDILKLKYLWAFAISILITYCLIIFLLPVPDCPTGYLGPGGLHLGENFSHCIGGATGYIDSLILGKHVYGGLPARQIYNADAFDPEGILGCLPSILQVILGVQSGTIFLTYKEHTRRVSRWILWALGTGLIGSVLCGFSKDDGAIPINKNLWSLSYVLVTTALALITFSLCYYIMDVLKVWTGKPIVYPGMNSTIMYVGHMMVQSNFPIRWFIDEKSVGTTHFLDLISCTWSTLMWILVAFYLYKIKFFLSI